MLRGAIDLVHPHRIGGWIYSELGSVRGRTVLAFVDGSCVGSGSVEGFRKDLAEAGLGDGYLGFSFQTSIKDPDDLQRAVVRLDGSDLVLMQSASKIAPRRVSDSFMPFVHRADSIEWMRSSGWLAPADFTFLKLVHQIGAYDCSLRQPNYNNPQNVDLLEPMATAQPLFDLLCLRKAMIVSLETLASRNLVELVLGSAKKPLPIVAFTCAETGSISVVEGSHQDVEQIKSLAGAVDYPYGPDRLLFLNWFVPLRSSPIRIRLL